MSEAVPPLSHTSSRGDAELNLEFVSVAWYLRTGTILPLPYATVARIVRIAASEVSVCECLINCLGSWVRIPLAM